MEWKFALIGCGNMGGAMLRRVLAEKIFLPSEVIVSDKNQALLQSIHSELGVHVTDDNQRAAVAPCVLLAVKPQFIDQVLSEIAPVLSDDTLVLSIVMGYGLKKMAALLHRENAHIVRVMPNTPALVGEGVLAACKSETVTEDEWNLSMRMLSCMGLTEEVPERLMEAVAGVSGCGPAYCFLLIEALADAGVRAGLPRAMAQRFAAQTLLGSAKMTLETGMHPGELKDMVTSPAGATIEGVAALEKAGFRSAAMDAVKAAVDRAMEFR